VTRSRAGGQCADPRLHDTGAARLRHGGLAGSTARRTGVGGVLVLLVIVSAGAAAWVSGCAVAFRCAVGLVVVLVGVPSWLIFVLPFSKDLTRFGLSFQYLAFLACPVLRCETVLACWMTTSLLSDYLTQPSGRQCAVILDACASDSLRSFCWLKALCIAITIMKSKTACSSKTRCSLIERG
jgi:hypothetical protein